MSKDSRPEPEAGESLRARAEAVVRDQEQALGRASGEGLDPQRLVHELRVHQVELEAQNHELRLTQLELEQSRARYRALYELAPVGYLTLDAEGTILTANLQAAALLGASATDLCGQALHRFVVPDDQDDFYLHRRALLASGAPRSFELRFARGEDERVFCQVEASAMLDSDDGTRAHVVLADITQRKAADAVLATAQKLEAIGLLAAGIAHDFNNVLAAVVGNLSLLQQVLPAGRPGADLVTEAMDASRTATGLARQLLTFSVGGAPELRLLDLRDLVRTAGAFAVRGSKSVCVFELGEVPLPVNVDDAQCSLLVQNLVLNAVQAHPGGGRIVFQARPVDVAQDPASPLSPGRYVQLTVQDQGPGLSAAEAARVFEPYYSTKATGHGLGLATASSVASKHGGSISVSATPGAGACFTIVLPAADRAATVPDASTLPVAPVVVPGRRVLILDDNDSVARMLARLFKQLGFEATVVHDGVEVVPAWRAALARGAPFECAVFDLTIPGGMGGAEAIVPLLALAPDAKVIVSSGYSGTGVMAEFQKHGFTSALNKPFSLADLVKALRELEADTTPP